MVNIKVNNPNIKGDIVGIGHVSEIESWNDGFQQPTYTQCDNQIHKMH